MRHNKKRIQLNRFSSWHKATMKSLVRNLIIHESVKTTLHRAKAVKSLAENLIALAKANTLSAKRDAFKILGDHKLVSVLFSDIGPRFSKRVGGYTRTISLSKRRGDDAQVVIFELTEKKVKPKKIKKAKDASAKPHADKSEAAQLEEGVEEKKSIAEPVVKERAPIAQKPPKKFLGGIRSIFKKKSDSL